MASGHVNRVNRPDTWLHRPMLQNVKKILANPEPSTHGPNWDLGLSSDPWVKAQLSVGVVTDALLQGQQSLHRTLR